MLLDRIQELDLIQHDPKSNVMSHFPLESRCVIIAQTNKYFLGDQSFPEQQLKSDAHITFVMEIIGQSFILPLYHLPIISESVAVYKNWLLNASRVPAAVGKFEIESNLGQIIIQSLIMQLSNVFRPRTLQEMVALSVPQTKPPEEIIIPLVNQHVDLCLIVTSFIRDIVESHSRHFIEETWVIILKVLLGICDSILAKPRGAPVAPRISINEESTIVLYMGDKLCENLIQLLTSVWIKCEVIPKFMWTKLKSLFVTWTHRNRIVKHWSELALEITSKVVSSAPRNRISTISPDESVNNSRLHFKWYQILCTMN